ncbi:MAG: exopolysaccharide biosynthesis polyprenyl glycosylphosphotransferase [Patescibacteria group bacterium]
MSRKTAYLIIDSFSFWLSFAVLALWRWQIYPGSELFAKHLLPFLLIFVLTIFIFYSMGLYENLSNSDWLVSGSIGLMVSFLTATAFFYFYSRFNPMITPRGSLVLFWLIFCFFSFNLRALVESLVYKKTKQIIGLIKNPKNSLIINSLNQASQLYQFSILEIPETFLENQNSLEEMTKNQSIKTIIGFSEALSLSQLKSLSNLNLEFYSLGAFFEQKLKKLNLEIAEKTWLLSSIRKQPLIREITERGLALALILIALPVWLAIILLGKVFSPGPIFFKQKRIGKNGKIFQLYKFRTMVKDAEKAGAQWAKTDDPRITSWGKIIRQTHLDELPQLINIFKGEMSFIGPRPERPEFVKELEEKIQFYSLRHLIKPGLTGWAQINYPYGASIEDAKNKLEFDLFYLKNRSLFLDLKILIKTFRFLFINLSRA